MFPIYPYHNIEDFNLDWIIKLIKKLEKEIDTFTALTKITWAGKWDITKYYTQWSLVDDNGNGYISIKPVPRNVPITDTNYWVLVADYSALYAAFSQRITDLENAVNNIDNIEIPALQNSLNGLVNTTIPSIQSNIDMLLDCKYYVTPEQFGAVGDGVTDDTIAFNTALTHNIVRCMPNKNYLISDNLTVLSDSVIYGNDSTITVADNSTIEGGIFSINNVDNVYITGFKFNKGTQTDYTVDESIKFYNTFIECIDASNIYIDKCVVLNLHSIAIRMHNCDGNLSIKNCEFYYQQSTMNYGNIFIRLSNNKIGANIDISDCSFVADHTDFQYGAGGVFMADERSHITIRNNTFNNMGRKGSPQPQAPVDLYKNNQNVVIDGNRFKHCIYMCRVISSAFITIINNIYNNEEELYPDTNVIPIFTTSTYATKEDTDHITVSNNIIISYAGSVFPIGISSHYDDFGPNTVLIDGNTIYSSKGAIIISKCAKYVKITNNNIQGQPTSALAIDIEDTNTSTIGSGYIDIIGNTITACNCGLFGTNLLANSGIVNMISNVMNVSCAAIYNNNVILNSNTITQAGLAEQDVMVSTPGAGELAYFTNNIVSSQFRIPSGTVITHDNYYNGSLI